MFNDFNGMGGGYMGGGGFNGGYMGGGGINGLGMMNTNAFGVPMNVRNCYDSNSLYSGYGAMNTQNITTFLMLEEMERMSNQNRNNSNNNYNNNNNNYNNNNQQYQNNGFNNQPNRNNGFSNQPQNNGFNNQQSNNGGFISSGGGQNNGYNNNQYQNSQPNQNYNNNQNNGYNNNNQYQNSQPNQNYSNNQNNGYNNNNQYQNNQPNRNFNNSNNQPVNRNGGYVQSNPQPNRIVTNTSAQPSAPRTSAPTSQLKPPKRKRPGVANPGAPLMRGQKIAITSNKVKIGLGWDIDDARCELDASAFMLGADNKIVGDEWFIFYGQDTSPDNSVKYKVFDIITECEDDAEVTIDLAAVSPNVEKIAFAITIYEASQNRLNFGMVKNVYARIIDSNTNKETAKFQLTECYDNVTALVVGELYRYKGTWKFNAVGSGVARDLAEFCGMYGVVLTG